jgi:hypothetical protein
MIHPQVLKSHPWPKSMPDLNEDRHGWLCHDSRAMLRRSRAIWCWNHTKKHGG